MSSILLASASFLAAILSARCISFSLSYTFACASYLFLFKASISILFLSASFASYCRFTSR